MNLRHPFFISSACFALSLSLFTCGTFPSLTGGTSETTNGFTAFVRDTLGRPVVHAPVKIRPRTYLTDTSIDIPNRAPVSIVDTITDEAGCFYSGSLDTGDYLIEVQSGQATGALITARSQKNRIVNCGEVIARPTGRIYGVVDLTLMPSLVTVYVQIYGLERLVRVDKETGSFIVNNLPHGSYTVRIRSSIPSFTPSDIPDQQVTSGAATGLGIVELVPFKEWRYSRRLQLNTTQSGAYITGTVTGFPVLVRLTPDHFPFSQAMIDGSDVRFAKQDGTPLAHEMERWDPAGGAAEIWVRTDTIRGNDSSRSIIMYWGNPFAAAVSSGSAVFSDADDFTGVWHLYEETDGRGNEGVYRDATGNGFHGMDEINATGREGIIGFGKNLSNKIADSASGQCDKITLPPSSYFVPTGTSPLTISMWLNIGELKSDLNRLFSVFTDTLGSTFALGIYKRDSVSLCLYSKTPSPWYPVTSTIPQGGWYHGAVTYSNGAWNLYINGTLVHTTAATDHGSGGNRSAVIGGFWDCRSTEPGFDGALDEVRFEKKARSTNWIRLCYLNQGNDDKLVVFK
ncbi:MAG: DUF2341 domain-containing protein [Chitinispirillaceae bacterium]|nr:DUF2341 domain-containing protein [Chitinispirillaceae bacterium]